MSSRPWFELLETTVTTGRLRKRKARRWYFVLKGGNGEVQFTSELYNSAAAAEVGIADVRRNMKQNPSVRKVPYVLRRR